VPSFRSGEDLASIIASALFPLGRRLSATIIASALSRFAGEGLEFGLWE
jgi:hypothetical protein